MNRDIASVILCGGKGTRMRSRDKHKVCFEIGGTPAIVHALSLYQSLDVHPHVLVLGAMAESVMETVSSHGFECLYAYQREQRGTGDAARVGARALQSLDYEGAVLVVAGDKYIEKRALDKLIQAFFESDADLAFLVNEKRPGSTAGRIFEAPGSGRPYNFEYWDLKYLEARGELARVLEQDPDSDLETLRARVEALVDHPRKARDFFPPLYGTPQAADEDTIANTIQADLETGSSTIIVEEKEYLPTEIEAKSTHVNVSVYLFKAPVLYRALAHLSPTNIQGEEYLTDVINYLSTREPEVKVLPVQTSANSDVQAFNTPGELLEIERYYQQKRVARERTRIDAKRPVGEWLTLLSKPAGDKISTTLRAIYGSDPQLIREKCAVFRAVVREFDKRFGRDRAVAIIRAPGRVNLLGRHVDHRGGDVNTVAIHREIVVVAAPRSDDKVVAHNLFPEKYGKREFAVGSLLEGLDWADWFEFIDKQETIDLIRDPAGDWGNYLKAALLRLQFFVQAAPLRGFDCVVHGDIPQAAGLSSSSALVVAIAEAAVICNELNVQVKEFIDICGEGEWFVGTRGGAADHAAIKCSKRDHVTKIGFFPFTVKDYAPFPADHALIVINSRKQAEKSRAVRQQFNERVLAYEVGQVLLLRRFPEIRVHVRHLRDINPDRLQLSQREIYEMIMSLPLELDLARLDTLVSQEDVARLRARFNDVPFDHAIPVRGIVLYGITECERSRRCFEVLNAGAIQRLGNFMNTSHDGDRVCDFTTTPPHSFAVSVRKQALEARVADLASEDPARVERGQLYNFPGSYRCSIPEIDYLVDIARAQEGVLGAQISGAGLGGCVMVLARKDRAPAILETLLHKYEEKFGISAEGFACTLVRGAGPLTPRDPPVPET